MNAIRCYDVAGPVFEFVTRLSIRRDFDNKHLLLLHHVALEDVNRTPSFFATDLGSHARISLVPTAPSKCSTRLVGRTHCPLSTQGSLFELGKSLGDSSVSPCTIKWERRQDALVPSERPVAGVAVTLWSSPAGEPNWDLLRLV